MSPSLVLATRALRQALLGFEPALLSGTDAAAVVEELSLTEKVCASARAGAAARAAECGAHREQGFANPADWLAKLTGATSGRARTELEAVKGLAELPDTRAAVAEGGVSLAEAGEIVKTEAECPGAEAELLAVAIQDGLRAVLERGRRIRLRVLGEDELQEKRARARQFRHWEDELGMVCLSAALLPEVGHSLVARLDAETQRVWKEANREGRRETRDNYAADAFSRLLDGKGKASKTRPKSSSSPPSTPWPGAGSRATRSAISWAGARSPCRWPRRSPRRPSSRSPSTTG